MLTVIPGSVEAYKPGIETVSGSAHPPPVTSIWAHSIFVKDSPLIKFM